MAELAEQKHPSVKYQQTDRSVQQYLTFLMEDDEYGIDILSVQEIHGWVEPRPIPNTPKHIRGVIDWRGTIVPIVDLRVRFSYAEATYDKTTVVIVLKSELEETGQNVVIGIVVDAVSDVRDVKPEDMRDAPKMGGKVDTHYIEGIAKVEDAMVVLLDLGKLVNLEEL
ncbi:MAG: chemotaxis protein CheW, partial [Gammaproteobacteria bacterium]|nr:chemotaxis protein CheW [Gammaproteobacteria bacterium]